MHNTDTIDAKTLNRKLLYPFDDIRSAIDALYDSRLPNDNFIKALDTIRVSSIEAVRFVNKASETYKAGEFVTLRRMQHDILAPTATMLSYSYFILEGLVGEITVEQQATLQTVIYKTNHLRRQIVNLIDYARLRAFPPEPNAQFALHSALKPRIIVMPGSKAIRWNIPEDLPEINASRLYITNTVVNLIANALEATPNGDVSVSAKLVDEAITVQVEDAGHGMSEEIQQAMRDLFYQAQPTPDQLGIGLTIASEQMRLQGSELKITSVEGKGTRASFQLPAIDKF